MGTRTGNTNGGGVSCSMPHHELKAKHRVFFKNGNCRDVCGWCVKQFRPGGKNARLVERVEKLIK